MQNQNRMKSGNDTSQLSHPLIVKMGGRQWIVGGDYAVPVETKLNEKLISLSSWTQQQRSAQAVPQPRKTRLHRLSKFYVDKLSIALDYIADIPVSGQRTEASSVSQVVAAGRKRPKASARGKRRIRDAFQIGIVFGLVLGCLTVLLFHQMKPLETVFPSTTNLSTNKILSGYSPGFMLPSVNLYTLQSGPFASADAAQKSADQLRRAGVPAIVHAGKTPMVWCGISIHANTLKSLQTKLNSMHVKSDIYAVQWNAMQVAGPGGETEESATQVSRWLSASAGSLRTLVGVLSNGGVQKDAEKAFETARPLHPSGGIVSSTGYDIELNGFWKSMTDSMTAFQEKHGTLSTIQVMQACEYLSKIQATSAEQG